LLFSSFPSSTRSFPFLLTFPSIHIQFPLSCFFYAMYVLIILQV
jgi:hypothetical protein